MNLFPRLQKPYYIYSPSYTHMSSGVRTLHLLCHALNEIGQKAYIIPDNPQSGSYCTSPALNTPLLQAQHQNYYQGEFIAVYPDIVKGNPMSAKHVVRYLLAAAGAYGGDTTFPDTDQIWAALPSISGNVLRIPVSDPAIFYDSRTVPLINREGSCFYSHKYEMHGNELLDITNNSKRLCGSLKEIADIMRRSAVCYLYEVSSIITEAALCGCLVVLVRTPYLKTIDPACMMGNVRWDDGEIVKKCDDFSSEYMKIMIDVTPQLHNFIQKTQELA